MNKFITIYTAMCLLLFLLTTQIIIHQANAQNKTSALDTVNNNENINTEKNTYILIFGQRIVGNVDNSTKIVSSIVGQNLIKIEEEFLEEISLAPYQQLEDQVEKVINDGKSGKKCAVNLRTQEGQKIVVDCLSSDNILIWYIHLIKE
jgi:hypothetical protein